MKKNVNNFSFVFVIFFTYLCLLPLVANAQALIQPPTVQITDSNGVNLESGKFDLPDMSVSIGNGNSGLSRASSFSSENNLNSINYVYGPFVGAGGQGAGNLWVMSVSYEGSTHRFVVGFKSAYFGNSPGINTGPYSEMNGDAKLSCSNGATGPTYTTGTCTMSLSDGTVVTYDNTLKSIYLPNGVQYVQGFATSATLSDGEIKTYNYYQSGDDTRAVKTVTSSLGWMIKNEVDGNYNVVKVGTVNLAQDYCDPSAATCNYNGASRYANKSINSGNVVISNNGNIIATSNVIANGHTISTPSGVVKTVMYDTNGKTSSVSIDGKTWNYSYSTDTNNGNVTTTVTAPNGTNEKLTVNPYSLVTKKTDALNRSSQYEWDLYYYLIQKSIEPDGNTSTGGYKTYAYDSNRNTTSVTTYPKNGGATLVSSSTFASTCDTTNYKYCHKPLTYTDEKGVTTTYTYDAAHGGILTETLPNVGGVQIQTRYGYSQISPLIKNSAGSYVAQPPVWRLTSVAKCLTQSLGNCAGTSDEAKTIYNYSPYNLFLSSITTMRGDGSLAQTTSYSYDYNGNTIAVDGPKPGDVDKSYSFYDALGRDIGSIGPDPDGAGTRPRAASRTNYDVDGRPYESISGTTNGTTYNDLVGLTPVFRQVTEYNASNGLPVFNKEYANESGNYVLKNVTQTSYDNMFRTDCVAQRLNPAVYGSLPASACTLSTAGVDGNDRITKFNYDALSEVVSQYSAYGTATQITDFTKVFDGVTRNLTSISDAKNNKTSYYYDNFNRLIKTCYPLAGSGSTSSTTDCVQIGYSGAYLGNITLRDGQIVNYGYDGLARLTTLGGVVSEGFSYNNYGLVTSHVKNGHYSNYSYNSLGWLLNENNDSAGSINIGYGYDTYGRRTSLTYPDGFVLGYNYNDADELTSLGENVSTAIISFGYDNYGNNNALYRQNNAHSYANFDSQLRLQTLNHINVNLLSFGYSTANQIKSRTNSNGAFDFGQGAVNDNYTSNGLNQIATKNSASFGYDARGNLTSDGVSSYAYNAENMLVSATQGGAIASLTYDAENRLQSLTKNGVTTKFVYDGTDLIAEYNGSNQLLRKYVHGGGVDEPLVWYEGAGLGVKRFLNADNQGSIIATTDATATPLNASRYDAYGNRESTNGAYASRFGYTGQMDLSELGLLNYKARMYDPKIGRFLQTDPIGYGDGMNWYNYVHNDAVNMIDPTGNVGCSGYYIQGTPDSSGQHVDRSQPFDIVGTWNNCGSSYDDYYERGKADDSRYYQQYADNSKGLSGKQCNGVKAGSAIAIGRPTGSVLGGAIETRGILSYLGLFAAILTLSGDQQQNFDLYRVVEPPELSSIMSTGQFVLSPSGFSQKQFWMNKGDADWYANSVTARGWSSNLSMVGVSVSRSTYLRGTRLSDAGHPFVSYGGADLAALNRDASKNGIKLYGNCK